VFDPAGAVVAMAQKEHRQIYPKPGWVEHSPEEILANTMKRVLVVPWSMAAMN
jgi:glycerol kinase